MASIDGVPVVDTELSIDPAKFDDAQLIKLQDSILNELKIREFRKVDELVGFENGGYAVLAMLKTVGISVSWDRQAAVDLIAKSRDDLKDNPVVAKICKVSIDLLKSYHPWVKPFLSD